jgi:Sensors of blue-light using FAD
MTTFQLVYSSRPFGFDNAMLAGILMAARRNNPAKAITGALICRADLYLQLLEGPRDEVEATYAKIIRDDRHCDVVQRVSRTSDHRMFPAWAMHDDPASDLIWSSRDVDTGAMDRASEGDFIAAFARVGSKLV